MLHGFPNVGSRERVFFEKLGIFRAKIQKFCILRAEILAKYKAKIRMQIYSKIVNGGHMSGALMVN